MKGFDIVISEGLYANIYPLYYGPSRDGRKFDVMFHCWLYYTLYLKDIFPLCFGQPPTLYRLIYFDASNDCIVIAELFIYIF